VGDLLHDPVGVVGDEHVVEERRLDELALPADERVLHGGQDRAVEGLAHEDDRVAVEPDRAARPHLEGLVEGPEAAREDHERQRVLVEHEAPDREGHELHDLVDGLVDVGLEREVDLDPLRACGVGRGLVEAALHAVREGPHRRHAPRGPLAGRLGRDLGQPGPVALGHAGHDPGSGARARRDPGRGQPPPEVARQGVHRVVGRDPGPAEEGHGGREALEQGEAAVEVGEERLPLAR
jgi:hypothetical protein